MHRTSILLVVLTCYTSASQSFVGHTLKSQYYPVPIRPNQLAHRVLQFAAVRCERTKNCSVSRTVRLDRIVCGRRHRSLAVVRRRMEQGLQVGRPLLQSRQEQPPYLGLSSSLRSYAPSRSLQAYARFRRRNCCTFRSTKLQPTWQPSIVSSSPLLVGLYLEQFTSTCQNRQQLRHVLRLF